MNCAYFSWGGCFLKKLRQCNFSSENQSTTVVIDAQLRYSKKSAESFIKEKGNNLSTAIPIKAKHDLFWIYRRTLVCSVAIWHSILWYSLKLSSIHSTQCGQPVATFDRAFDLKITSKIIMMHSKSDDFLHLSIAHDNIWLGRERKRKKKNDFISEANVADYLKCGSLIRFSKNIRKSGDIWTWSWAGSSPKRIWKWTEASGYIFFLSVPFASSFLLKILLQSWVLQVQICHFSTQWSLSGQQKTWVMWSVLHMYSWSYHKPTKYVQQPFTYCGFLSSSINCFYCVRVYVLTYVICSQLTLESIAVFVWHWFKKWRSSSHASTHKY